VSLITVSIVSHGHADLLVKLLDDLEKYCVDIIEVILTENIPDEKCVNIKDYKFKSKVIKNLSPKGFAENHNQAFLISSTSYFCVLNPDIRLKKNPFEKLVNSLNSNDDAVLIAPLVINSDGLSEDSIRRFPSPISLLMRVLRIKTKNQKFQSVGNILYPEWVAGMFMLFKADFYRNVNGFNEIYYLYCEDIDICTRIWRDGFIVMVDDSIQVIHDAQRSSHKKMKYLMWHISSLFKYFCLYFFKIGKIRKLYTSKIN